MHTNTHQRRNIHQHHIAIATRYVDTLMSEGSECRSDVDGWRNCHYLLSSCALASTSVDTQNVVNCSLTGNMAICFVIVVFVCFTLVMFVIRCFLLGRDFLTSWRVSSFVFLTKTGNVPTVLRSSVGISPNGMFFLYFGILFWFPSHRGDELGTFSFFFALVYARLNTSSGPG